VDKIQSADGTIVAFKQSGSGLPLVLVHGGGAGDHKRWDMAGVRLSLAKYFRVYAIDRRGRGESGDASDYKLEREFEDIAAVVNSIDQPVILLGHSLGAQISLEAALLTNNIYKLILYEPVFQIGDYKSYWAYSNKVVNNMQKLIDEGKNEQALILFLKELVELTTKEIDEFRLAPNWQDRVNAVHTIAREEKASAEYKFEADRLKNMAVPTLLLSGSESPSLFKKVTEVVNQALPNSRIAVFQGQGHIAMNTAPDLFIDVVLAFSRE
jgi:pimeloyl-ACP methyl ester carboxylesterase